MSGMFDDASEDEDEVAVSLMPSPAVAAGLPVRGSTTQQPVKERCHIMGPQLDLSVKQAVAAEQPLLCSDDENIPEDDEENDNEHLDDVLADVDWQLGSATGRYKAMIGGGQMNSNAGRVHSKTYDDPNFQPIERSKLFSKIEVGRLDENTHDDLSKRVNQSVRAIVASDDKERVRKKDKADRATVEQVIDPRTRMILFKLLKNDYIQEIYGTISTGKEANVYHSVAGLTLDEVGNRKTSGFVSKAAVGRAERKAAREAKAAEQLDDEALMLLARKAQAARLQKISQEPEPEPEPKPLAATENQGLSDEKQQQAAARARAFLKGEVSVVRMNEGEEEEDGADVDKYMPEIAIKIFKTSILVFKDRKLWLTLLHEYQDRYVTGDHRFRGGYSKHNPRKMVKAWAEKEFRNLNRLWQCGVRCPRPRMLRNHVLLMEFIGENGVAAPRLKDAEIDVDAAHEAYLECVRLMWRMYNEACLVHGDLSEYNILYHQTEVYFIDVSQSVEHDHPASFDFLRKDCENVTNFFFKKGVGAVMTLRELFDFITDSAITAENFEDYLDKMMEVCQSRPAPTPKEMVAAEVFKKAFIPQKLADIDHYEREIIKMTSKDNNAGPRRTALDSAYDDLLDPVRGNGDADDDDFLYRKVVGLDPAKRTSRLEPELLVQQETREPRQVVVEFKEPGKLGVSFDRDDADLKVVEVADGGLAAQEGSIRPGMQLHAVESAALGGLVHVAGLGYTQALGTVAKAGRPMALTFLSDAVDGSDDEQEEEESNGDLSEEEWVEREVLHDSTGRPTEAVKADKKANKKAVKAANKLKRMDKVPKKVKKRKDKLAKRR